MKKENIIKQYNLKYTNPIGSESTNENNILLTKNLKLANSLNGVSNNCLVFSRNQRTLRKNFLLPNIRNMNSNKVIVDIDGKIYNQTVKEYEDAGYDVCCLDFRDLEKSMSYNPFNYIYDERDMNVIFDCLVGNSKSRDPFFTKTEQTLFKAFVYFFMYENQETVTFRKICSLLNSNFDYMFEDLDRDSEAYKYYRQLDLISEKTRKSAEIDLYCLLKDYQQPENESIFCTDYDNLNFEKIFNKKTIFYIIISSIDNRYDYLADLAINQLISNSIHYLEREEMNNFLYPIDVFVVNLGGVFKLDRISKYTEITSKYNFNIFSCATGISQLSPTIYDAFNVILVLDCDKNTFDYLKACPPTSVRTKYEEIINSDNCFLYIKDIGHFVEPVIQNK